MDKARVGAIIQTHAGRWLPPVVLFDLTKRMWDEIRVAIEEAEDRGYDRGYDQGRESGVDQERWRQEYDRD